MSKRRSWWTSNFFLLCRATVKKRSLVSNGYCLRELQFTSEEDIPVSFIILTGLSYMEGSGPYEKQQNSWASRSSLLARTQIKWWTQIAQKGKCRNSGRTLPSPCETEPYRCPRIIKLRVCCKALIHHLSWWSESLDNWYFWDSNYSSLSTVSPKFSEQTTRTSFTMRNIKTSLSRKLQII